MKKAIKNISFSIRIRIIFILLILFLVFSLYSIRKIAFVHIYKKLLDNRLSFLSLIIGNHINKEVYSLSKLNNSNFLNFILKQYQNDKERNSNLSIVMKDLNINFICLRGMKSSFKWEKYINSSTYKNIFISERVENSINHYLKDAKTPSHGIVNVNGEYYLVDIENNLIELNGKTFPAIVVIGSSLTKELNYISRNYDCTISYNSLNKKVNGKIENFDNNEYLSIEVLHNRSRRMQLNDVFNNPVLELIISIDNKKIMSNLSINGIMNIAFSILVFTIVVSVVLALIVFEKIGINRIKKLNKQLYSIIDNLDLYNIIEENGNDEIGKLQRNINRLLNNSKNIKDVLRKEKYNFKYLLEGKTKELVAVNSLLYKKLEEHRKMENILRESEGKYRKVVNNAHEAILIIQDDAIIFANEKSYELIGYNKEEVINKNFVDFVYEDDRELVERLYKERIKGKVSDQSTLVRVISKKGEIHWTEISSVIINLQGIASLLVFMKDVTESIRIEEDKKNLQKQLLQAQKMEAIGRLASGIAHDFNNMLTPIIGYSDIMLFDDQLPDNYKGYLNEIKKSASRASSLTKQLLLFSKRQTQTFAIVDVNKIINSMKKLFMSLIKESIKIRFDLQPKIRKVKADKGKLEQVLMNLIINAGDAIQSKGTIVIKTFNIMLNNNKFVPSNYSNREYVAISVKDNGIGIDEATKERVFEPFFTTKGTDKGTGLGLSVVYSIIQQHNGWVDLESEPGKGSNFIIYLPAVDDAIEYDELENINTNNNWKSIKGKNKKVLLVEDNEYILSYAHEALTRHEFSVITASSYKEALEAIEIEGKAIDLLFTDIVMPGGSGIDLAMEIKNRYPHIKVLLTSGHTTEYYELDKIKKYGYKFISKPYSVADLLQYISNQLKNS